MKKATTLLRVVPLLLILALLLVSCGTPVPASWEDATYKKDATVGDGDVTVTVKVTADDKTVTLTLRTDEDTLADALLSEELCAGEESTYGLYIKYVNGIRADYELDSGYWWNLLVNGEVSMLGASGTSINAGDIYEFVRTK